MDIYLHKNPLKQAPALTVNMLCVLELASFCEKDKFLRAFAGFILFCVYGRLRVSDLNRLVHCSLLGNYVEGSLMKVKTARSKEKQCTFLPVVAPAMGVLGTRWFQAFALNRATLELDNIPSLESRASNESFGVLPSESTIHLDCYSKIDSAEVAEGLQRILGKVFSREELCDYKPQFEIHIAKWLQQNQLRASAPRRLGALQAYDEEHQGWHQSAEWNSAYEDGFAAGHRCPGSSPLPAAATIRQHESRDEDANKVKKLNAASSDNEERLKRQIQNLQGQIKNLQSGGSAGKGRGKRKDKEQAHSYASSSHWNESDYRSRRTNDFNLSGCSKAKPGDKCPKGYHTCMRPGCNEAHRQKQHPGK